MFCWYILSPWHLDIRNLFSVALPDVSSFYRGQERTQNVLFCEYCKAPWGTFWCVILYIYIYKTDLSCGNIIQNEGRLFPLLFYIIDTCTKTRISAFPFTVGSAPSATITLSGQTQGQLLRAVITLHLSTNRCKAVWSPGSSAHNNSWGSAPFSL